MISLKLPTLLIIGIWIGMLIALSFLEAPLKFTAPNITTKLGVGIGRIMFNALNKAEIIFSLLLIILFIFLGKQGLSTNGLLLFGAVLLIVLLQTVWFLPALDMRAQNTLADIANTPSQLHLVYVICEVIKLGLLFFLFKTNYQYE